MSLHTKQEFSKLCGLATNALSVYIKRGKIILTGELIDDTKQENIAFLSKRKGTDLTEKIVTTPAGGLAVVHKTGDIKSEQKTDSESKTDLSAFALDKIKKEKDIEKISEEVEILKVKKEKLHGIVIPTEVVKAVFSQHTKSILVEFSNSADKILTIIAKKYRISNKDAAVLRKQFIDEINIAVNKSIDESKKNIKDIVDTFAEKRGKGERV